MAKEQPYGGGSSSLSDFKQLALLGEGSYSAVYKVLRLADQQIYALKKVKLPSLSDKEKQNALNEVRLLASLRHENVVAYKEAFFDERTRCLCIVTECADSGDLFQRITRCQKERSHLPETDAWRYIFGMCHGLKAMHDKRILHRDMKSANVFLSTSGDQTIAKLGDFNVSKVAKRGLCMTQTGTPYYASPEVWRDMPYDAKSDLWSLGCVIFEMVALKPPFRAEDMEGLYRKVLRGQYSRIPPHYSSDLSELISVLLQVNPRHRPSVEELIELPVMRRHAQDSSPEYGRSDLLQTIGLPKNVFDFSNCLPKPQYDVVSVSSVQDKALGGRGQSAAVSADVSRADTQDEQDVCSPPAPRQSNSTNAADARRQDPEPDSLDNYLQEKRQLPPARQAPAHADQDPLAAAAILRAANPRGRRNLAKRDPDNSDRGNYGGGREAGRDGRGAPQHYVYSGLPQLVPASPAPSSHAPRSQLSPYVAREQHRRGGDRKPMANYARAQYAIGSASAAQPAARQPSEVGQTRLPQIL